MLNVHYSLTDHNNFLKELVTSFGSVYREKIYVENNGLVFPESLAKGRVECYDIDAGLGLVIMDCVFFEDINFVRNSAPTNYFHSISFNITAFYLMVNRHGEKRELKIESWKNKIFYSTAEISHSLMVPKNVPIKIVALLLSREWLINKYKLRSTKNKIYYQEEILEDYPLQFTLDLNLETLLLAQEIIAEEPPPFLSKLFYKGSAKRLLALTLEIETRHSQSKTALKYEDVVRVMNVKKKIEENLAQPLPTLDDLAKTCHMVPSKFDHIFKAMYSKNYVKFFKEVRLVKATVLLKKKQKISEIDRKSVV